LLWGAAARHAAVVGRLLGRALVVDSVDEARAIAATASVPVVTRQGEVFRGYGRVEGGSRRDARGILETRAEVEALSERVTAGTGEVAALSATLADLDAAIAAGASALAAMAAEQHEHEKRLVALEAQATRAADDRLRVSRRLEVVATERARAEDERAAAAARGDEAAAAIELHDAQQREAQAGLDQVSARLQAAREDAEARLRLVTESRTEQATLVERAAALDTEVARLDEAARELEARIAARTAEIQRTETRRTELSASLVETEHRLDENIAALDALKVEIRDRDEHVGTLRVEFTARDQEIRTARHDHDAARAVVAELDVTLARANADLAHLRETAVEAVGAPLDEVVAAVAALDASGGLTPPRMRGGAGTAADVESDEEDAESAESSESAVSAAAVGEAADEVAAAEAPGESAGEDPAETVTPAAAAGPAATPDEVIAWLRGRIDRLGPVNMMAIEQFDELETRHAFLTTQRQDLLDSIAQTGEAIRKIDKTTRERFAEAFEVINGHFEQTFTTLFGGGRAGLTLIDQENEAESGIDIIAQPPGKRLQNVQLLSGGEKALTAMALMFAIFKYRPSPFCLLDEIDAPLDDANIGRFIEMLEGMQAHTQFILITHNRKTMEIARRLYGVTMEEPGVSKLISLQLN
jgi:chromosome segregation protein